MNNKEKNFASAVIYVHNAEDRIVEFVNMIKRTLEDNFEHSEIICVNDASEDESVTLIKNNFTSSDRVNIAVVNMSYYHGLEMAMNAGTDFAIGDYVFEFDNTVLDFESSVIMQIYRHALSGIDIVSASPKRKDRLSSKVFYWIFNKYTNRSQRIGTESFRVLSRRVINRISSMNKTVPYRKAVCLNSGLRMDNMAYYVTTGREVRFDKKERKYRSTLAVDTLILFTEVGYRFSAIMTAVMMIVSVLMVVYSITIYLLAHPVEGWTTTVLFLSIAFFGLFGILTIIIKYLQLIIDLVFKRKHYSFESIEKLNS